MAKLGENLTLIPRESEQGSGKNARRRGFAALTATLALSGFALAACGQTAPPSTTEIQQNVHYFDLPGTLTPKGKPVECVEYGSGTSRTTQSKSWFAFACDFSGSAHLPSPDTSVPTELATAATPER